MFVQKVSMNTYHSYLEIMTENIWIVSLYTNQMAVIKLQNFQDIGSPVAASNEDVVTHIWFHTNRISNVRNSKWPVNS